MWLKKGRHEEDLATEIWWEGRSKIRYFVDSQV
jgi:hypothetical protein